MNPLICLLDRLRDEEVVVSVTAPATPVGDTWTDPFTGVTYRITRHRPHRGHPWGGVTHFGVPVGGK